MPRQYIGTNIRKIQDVIDYAQANDKEYAILFLDFKKAFDSVSHIFLWSLMLIINFSPEYISWIMLLYCQAESTVQNQGWFTMTFPLGRGV